MNGTGSAMTCAENLLLVRRQLAYSDWARLSGRSCRHCKSLDTFTLKRKDSFSVFFVFLAFQPIIWPLPRRSHIRVSCFVVLFFTS